MRNHGTVPILTLAFLLVLTLAAPTAMGQADSSRTTDLDLRTPHVPPGGTLAVDFEILLEGTAYRDVLWYAYLVPGATPGPDFSEDAVLLIPIDGPTEVPEGQDVNFTTDVPLPPGLTGTFGIGFTWDGEMRGPNDGWVTMRPTRTGTSATTKVVIGPEDGGTLIPGFPAVSALAAGLIALQVRRAKR